MPEFLTIVTNNTLGLVAKILVVEAVNITLQPRAGSGILGHEIGACPVGGTWVTASVRPTQFEGAKGFGGAKREVYQTTDERRVERRRM